VQATGVVLLYDKDTPPALALDASMWLRRCTEFSLSAVLFEGHLVIQVSGDLKAVVAICISFPQTDASAFPCDVFGSLVLPQAEESRMA
jgi:hypothetical protein